MVSGWLWTARGGSGERRERAVGMDQADRMRALRKTGAEPKPDAEGGLVQGD